MHLPQNLKKLIHSPVAVSILISVCFFLGIMGLRSSRCLQFMELEAYDLYLRWQGQADAFDPRIVLITISEEDIQRMGVWPVTDLTLARVLEVLNSYGPKAIGLDLYRDIPVPPGGEEFAAIFTKTKNIVTVRKIGDETSRGIPQPYILEEEGEARVGFNDILLDPGGTVRRGLLFLTDKGETYYSFSLRIAMVYLANQGIVPLPDETNPDYMHLGASTYRPFESNDGGYVGADARGYQFLIDFHHKGTGFTNYPLTDLLSQRFKREALHDKIVLIGVTAESVNDAFFTPFSRGSEASHKFAGVELHALMISQLIRSALGEGSGPPRVMHDGYEWLWILLWCLLGGMIALFRHSIVWFFLVIVVGILVLFLITFALFHAECWIPLVPPVIAWCGSAAMVNTYLSHKEKVQRALLMQLFSSHVSEDVAKAIWEEREQFLTGGRPSAQRLTATVLFTDLMGFTTVSERLEPQRLMAWLNEYMEAMAYLVMEHNGVVNKYIGDSIMAVFGIPIPRKDTEEIAKDAINAVECALFMGEEIKRLNTSWEDRNLPTTQMRIGIFTGPLVAGSLGSKKRMEYTVIGDTVNIASCLEGLYKEREDPDLEREGYRIFIGEETLRHLGRRFDTELIGAATLKGKGEQKTIYRVKGRKEGTGKRLPGNMEGEVEGDVYDK